MTFLYPDISHYNAGFVITSALPVVAAKATEGLTYVDPTWSGHRVDAKRAGVPIIAYHWLHHGNVVGQATQAFAAVGPDIPLMIDAEDTGTALTVADIAGFTDAYRQFGGKVPLLYLPEWYWRGNMHAPSLSTLVSRGLLLVASAYRAYSDSNWPAAYGGMTPYVWQFTNNYQGSGVDYNACKDSIPAFLARINGGSAMAAAGVFTQQQCDDIVYTLIGNPAGPIHARLTVLFGLVNQILGIKPDYHAMAVAFADVLVADETLPHITDADRDSIAERVAAVLGEHLTKPA